MKARTFAARRPHAWAWLCAVLALVACAACASNGKREATRQSAVSSELRRLLEEQEREVAKLGSPGAKNILRRAAVARDLYTQGRVVTATDKLFAAALLYETYELDDLATSETLALEAAQEGDPRGFEVAAEAIDRQLMRRNLPQRYGTQYLYDPVDDRWTLYPVDPETSDAERAAMGVAPLAELVKREAFLNDPALHRRAKKDE